MRRLSEVQRFYILVILLPLAACTSLFLLRPVLDKPGRTLCIFRQATGLPCPACNTGHGVYALLGGDMRGALYQNPVSVLAVVFGVLAVGWLIKDAVTRTPGLFVAFKKTEAYLKSHRLLLVLLFALIAANWGWQLYKHFQLTL